MDNQYDTILTLKCKWCKAKVKGWDYFVKHLSNEHSEEYHQVGEWLSKDRRTGKEFYD
jgi:hypothetical protein